MRNLDIDTLVNGILNDVTITTADSGAEVSSVSVTEAPVSTGADVAIFNDVDSAVQAASAAFSALNTSPIKVRQDIVDAMRARLADLIPQMAEKACAETGMGNVPHKIAKNEAALYQTPGTEDLDSRVITGDLGMTLFEYSPYGVVGAICPSTNPTETIMNNAIGMISAGNTVFFSPHPGAKQTSIWLIKIIEQIIFEVSGIRNVIVSVANPSFDATKAMMAHPEIPILVVTGGPGIVDMAMKTGKKVIGAGAGNPPVIVDETANIRKAAQDIIKGASFDYNVPCVAEKEVIAVEQIAPQLLDELEANGAFVVKNQHALERIKSAVIGKDGHVNKELVGKSPATILNVAGIAFSGEPKLVVVCVANDDPLIKLEQLMPCLPVTTVRDFDAALALAVEAECGYLHTAIMHSHNVYRLGQAAKTLRTTIFVKNAPSYAALGVEAEGFVTFTIATPTGEGTTSARSFARLRRCVLSEGFNIR
ncbi:aldehyde dehydrogenase family protein [Thaumasiovibrio sp. DFM-14]|uniref:aldehyde dehydrogenase family protein n=1 Tax=Thaumasiovibrio sp. DFM-14 TaxID=3384792 RepID=UPI0039A220C4